MINVVPLHTGNHGTLFYHQHYKKSASQSFIFPNLPPRVFQTMFPLGFSFWGPHWPLLDLCPWLTSLIWFANSQVESPTLTRISCFEVWLVFLVACFPDPLSPFLQLVVPGEFSKAPTNICRSYAPEQTVTLKHDKCSFTLDLPDQILAIKSVAVNFLSSK